MTEPHEGIDPEVLEGLDAYLELVGPGGLGAIEDIGERRARFELIASTLGGGGDRVERREHVVPAPTDGAGRSLRLYRPAGTQGGVLPAIYFIHGGGMTMGSLETEDRACARLCERLGCAVLSIDYRLAPENPHPAPVEDCYAGLAWTAQNAAELGVDPARIAIFGASAGGGLAAATTLMARDRGGPSLRLQMLLGPMLDDRGETPSSQAITDVGVWDRPHNLEAWSHLLGDLAGTDAVSAYAAPARADDLAGLPPTYIDVGGLDLLRDEVVEYGARAMRAGVPTELHVYPGMVHGAEFIAPRARLSKRSAAARLAALRVALELDGHCQTAV